MKIEAGLNLTDLSKVIKKLESIQRQLEKKSSRFCKKVAEEGRAEASRVYGGEVQVSVVPIDNGYSIQANGYQVCFLEFGAGVETNKPYNPLSNEFTAQTGIEVKMGSYSAEHGHQLDYKDYWIYKGDIYDHVTPQPGLWRASQKIQEVAEKVAKEVFG